MDSRQQNRQSDGMWIAFDCGMTMINPNVTRAVSEVLDSHQVTQGPGERMSDAVARALGLSKSDTERWLEALVEGCPVEEANRRAGIASHRESEPLLIALARAIGKAVAKVAK